MSTPLLSNPVRSARSTRRAQDPVDRAAAALAAGGAVVVVDDAAGGTGEGDLLVAAELVTSATMAFVVRHSGGFVRVALPGQECDRLGLPPMRTGAHGHRAAAHAVAVDAADGVGTGISAGDRARTARVLADPAAVADDLVRPGHVVPVRVDPDAPALPAGPAEAGLDLARGAGLRPAAVLTTVVSAVDPLSMARGPELAAFAARHGLVAVGVADVLRRAVPATRPA